MFNLVKYPFFYILVPATISIFLLLIFFNLPNSFYEGIFFLISSILFCFLLFGWIFKFKYRIDVSYNELAVNKKYKLCIIIFCFIIIIFGGVDILVNGLKILDPSTYAEFNGIGRYIRHITIMCWVLIPVGFVYFGRDKIKYFFILYALIFPILIVDRNRLFSSFYALLFCVACNFLSANEGRKKFNYGTIYLLFFVLLIFFSIIGYMKSGADALAVESSGDVLSDEMYPLGEAFFYIPRFLQQVILYLTSPILNFATVYSENFVNPDFLLSQLSPFNRDNYDAYPYSPILISRFNVGTEFYPWFLWGGAIAAFVAIFLMIFSFFISIKLLERKANIFTLLIFIKISYTILFMGFGPQFYILFNFSFVVVILILWGIGVLLNKIKRDI